ncbi:MAG: PDZ domain-containing protein [Granulosicoccus sp.]
MTDEIQGNLLTHSAIAVFAGALGCVATLFAVGVFDSAETVAIEVSESNGAQVASSNTQLNRKALPPELTLEALQIEILSAGEERSQMAETLLRLSRELESAQQQLESFAEGEATRLALASASAQPQTPQAQENRFRSPNRLSGEERMNNMIAAGIDEQTARYLQNRRDKHQLARLELFDQAAREGWDESEELSEKLAELDAQRINLREEIGDDAYDRLLFESGDTNRVSIASVITGSAAEIAGLELGDLIINYDNERVFNVRELQQATRSGTKGEYVQILFDRGGRLLSADIPRGPMGVTLSTSTVMP